MFNFCAKSLRNLYVIFCATCVITNPSIIPNAVLKTYNPSKVNKMFLIFTKLIPAPPDSFPIIPLNTSVVALPSIFGPNILNTVLATANMKIMKKANLYFDK